MLLKDEDNIIPMNKNTINSILLVGPNAAVMRTNGAGSSWVTPFYSISPKEGIENYIGVNNVLYAEGCNISIGFSSDISEAFQMSEETDVVIFFGGLDPSREGEGLDRANGSILLPGVQNDLINILASKNENIVVVLFSGGICSATPFIDNIKGLIYGFYLGQEGGNAIAQVLFGDYNTSGKLPVTFPRAVGQVPVYYNHKNSGRPNNPSDKFTSKYMNLPSTPLFPFGYGLSYTKFKHSNLRISSKKISSSENLLISVDVKNIGDRGGDEIVQLYIHDIVASVTRPVKELKGFRRISVAPNEKKRIEFILKPKNLGFYDQNMKYIVEPGEFEVMIGSNSMDLLKTKFELVE